MHMHSTAQHRACIAHGMYSTCNSTSSISNINISSISISISTSISNSINNRGLTKRACRGFDDKGTRQAHEKGV